MEFGIVWCLLSFKLCYQCHSRDSVLFFFYCKTSEGSLGSFVPSLVTSALVTWVRWCLLGFSTIKLFFLSFIISIYFVARFLTRHKYPTLWSFSFYSLVFLMFFVWIIMIMVDKWLFSNFIISSAFINCRFTVWTTLLAIYVYVHFRVALTDSCLIQRSVICYYP